MSQKSCYYLRSPLFSEKKSAGPAIYAHSVAGLKKNTRILMPDAQLLQMALIGCEAERQKIQATIDMIKAE